MRFIQSTIDYLIANDSILRNNLFFFPNDTLYYVYNEIRYIEYYFSGNERKHQVVCVENNKYLKRLFHKGKYGLTISQYTDLLSSMGIDDLESKSFIEELIQNQLLKCELDINITGDDPLCRIINYLNKHNPDNKLIAPLNNIYKQINSVEKKTLDTVFFNTLINELKKTEVSYLPNHIIQCDCVRKDNNITINQDVVNQVIDTLSFLNRIIPKKKNPLLEEFKNYFLERYNEGEKIPLLLALDPEIGYKYGVNDFNHSELIGDMILPDKHQMQENKARPHEMILLNKIIKTLLNQQETLMLDKEDFSGFKEDWDDVPPTLSVLTQIIDEQNIFIEIAGGSSAANIISRFAGLDEKII